MQISLLSPFLAAFRQPARAGRWEENGALCYSSCRNRKGLGVPEALGSGRRVGGCWDRRCPHCCAFQWGGTQGANPFHLSAVICRGRKVHLSTHLRNKLCQQFAGLGFNLLLRQQQTGAEGTLLSPPLQTPSGLQQLPWGPSGEQAVPCMRWALWLRSHCWAGPRAANGGVWLCRAPGDRQERGDGRQSPASR